jgi:DinB superfamily
VAIEPDGKDWTWVLQRPCPECGFEAASIARDEVSGLLTANAASWVALLAQRTDADLRRRPDAQTWSPLEYACHVRDVFVLFDFRLGLMLTTDDPLFPNWDQDVTAVESDYPSQQPAQVSADLDAAAQVLAAHFADLADKQWARPGRRSDGASFTVESFARYLVHDPVHHLYDVR